MMGQIQRRLGWKLFISYLVVILIDTVILATIAELAIPRAFEQHLAEIEALQGDDALHLEFDLFNNLRDIVTDTLTTATVVAFILATAVSLFVSRTIINPVRQMTAASQRIANGDYHERVSLSSNPEPSRRDELGQLADSFNQMAATLEQTEETRLTLIGNVAHELRTPLTTIKGFMEGLIDGVLPAEPQTFQQIYREADRLQRLAESLQALSQVEAKIIMVKPQPTAIFDLVEPITSQLNYQYQEKGVALSVEIAENLPSVMADPDRLNQVLLNLLGNALQFTPQGGQVSLRATQENQMVVVTITDTGIGLTPEQIPHVFTRFYRVDKSRSRVSGGSGIGLTIVKHLVEAQGGQVWVESAGLGQGCSFGFSLPL